MAGAPEVLALSDDDEDTPFKIQPRFGSGSQQGTPITPGNVVCLDSDNDEFEVKRSPIVSAKVGWQRTFSEPDDCCVVKITPSSNRHLKFVLEDDCSIVKEIPSSSKRLPPRETTVISQQPELDFFTDWAPHWSPDSTSEVDGVGVGVGVEDGVGVEEPRAKRQKPSDHAPFSCDVDMTLEAGLDNEEGPRSVEVHSSASRGQISGEEERQKRLREKELELERKQFERAEKKREKEEANERRKEELKKRKEDERARKAAAKKAAADKRKAEHEAQKFNGKLALERMIAFVDIKVAEKGLIGGQLLSRFEQRKLTKKLQYNPLGNSIIWRTQRPRMNSSESDIESQDSQVFLDEVDVQHLVFVFDAEEFSAMVAESSLFSHVQKAQLLYPGYTVCYVVNRLTAFLKKKDQDKYQAPHDPANIRWHRPPVEKALAGLLTNFTGVHSRLCVDEAEVADHVTGLMPVLANSYYKPKLTKLSVSKNGEHVRDDVFKDELGENFWLKALVAIPKVPSSCAISIGRVYPTMHSLYKIYLNKEKTDRDKELLLQDLPRESGLGSTSGQRRVGPVCSRAIFHVLMAQDGTMKVDDIQQGVHQDGRP